MPDNAVPLVAEQKTYVHEPRSHQDYCNVVSSEIFEPIQEEEEAGALRRQCQIHLSTEGTNKTFSFFRFHSHPKSAKSLKAYPPPLPSSYHSLPVLCLVLFGFVSRKKRKPSKVHSKVDASRCNLQSTFQRSTKSSQLLLTKSNNSKAQVFNKQNRFCVKNVVLLSPQ